MEHIIWQDRIYQNDKDWEGYAEEFCDINGIEFKEEDRFQYEDGMNIEYLNAEKNYNLNIETKHHIICIADVGR